MNTPAARPLPDATQALLDVGAGDPSALNRLFPLVYDGLLDLARSRFLSDMPDDVPVAIPLVHEAYLALVDQTRVQRRNRSHFLATASLAMRRLMVDHARASTGPRVTTAGKLLTPEDAEAILTGDEAERILALDAALDRLRAFHPRGADIAVCRFFGGLDLHETAEALGVAPATVKRDWSSARAWLLRELKAGDTDPDQEEAGSR